MARGTVVARTLKNGKKRYYTAIWVETPEGGKKQQWRTFAKRKDADAFLDERSTEVRGGDYREPVKITFSDFADEWLQKYPRAADDGPLKPSTVYGYQSIIEAHLRPFFDDMLLERITAATIERDFKAQLPVSTGPSTVTNILILLQRMLKSAVGWEYINKNPFRGRSEDSKVSIPGKKKEQFRGRALDPEGIRSLLNNCLDDAYPIVATALLTGMRRSEVFGLRFEDLDFGANKIRVRQTLYMRRGQPVVFVSPKSKASVRDIDMSPKLRTILLEHKLRTADKDSPHSLVFTNSKGMPVDPNNFVKRRFVPAVKAAGLGHMRFHDLRHCYGSLKIEQGENLDYVQRQMGHSSIQVTLDIYSHLLKKSYPEAAEKTDSLIFGTG